jgi:hypothetical protein
MSAVQDRRWRRHGLVLGISDAGYATATMAPGQGIRAAAVGVDIACAGYMREGSIAGLYRSGLTKGKDDGDRSDQEGQGPTGPPKDAADVLPEGLHRVHDCLVGGDTAPC